MRDDDADADYDDADADADDDDDRHRNCGCGGGVSDRSSARAHWQNNNRALRAYFGFHARWSDSRGNFVFV